MIKMRRRKSAMNKKNTGTEPARKKGGLADATPTEKKKGFSLSGVDIVALALCLLAAVVIWLYATNVTQTLVEKDIYVTVNANREIESKGYNIIYGDAKLDYSQIIVKLTVTGTQAALAKYEDSQYTVRLDTDSIDGADDYAFRFRCDLPGSDVSVKSISPTYVSTPTVHIDRIVTKEVELKCEYEGGVPSGLRIGEITAKDKDGNAISKVTIKGPEQVINTVESVAAQVKLNGYQVSFETKCKTFELVTSDGEKKDAAGQYVSIEPSEVNIYIQILCSDRQIPLLIRYSGGATGVKYSVHATFADDGTDAMIMLSGDTALFTENQSIAYDLGNISEVADHIELTVGDLTIPDGLTLVTPKDRKIIITVTRESGDNPTEQEKSK